MQCRNALRQHVISSISPTRPACNHIWISDELLSEAFTRYVRVSNISRRHGSNAPGPLEARRRQSRRRMGFSSGEYTQQLPVDEFGPLFGSNRYIPGSYSWQAPNTAAETLAKPTKTGPLQALTSFWDVETQERESEDIKKETNEVQAEAVAASRSAFAAYLHKHNSNAKLYAADLVPYLNFLESAVDEPRACNVDAFVHWLRDKKIDVSAFESVRDFILSKHRLQTLSNAQLARTLPAFVSLAKTHRDGDWSAAYAESMSMFSEHLTAQATRHPTDRQLANAYAQLFRAIVPQPGYEHAKEALEMLCILAKSRNSVNIATPLVARSLASVLNRLSNSQLQPAQYNNLKSLFVAVLQISQEDRLAQRVTRMFALQKPILLSSATHRKRLAFWLNCVHESGLLAKTPENKDWLATWSIYHIIGSHFSPADLSSHLCRLSRVELATAILLGWSGSIRAVPTLKMKDHSEDYRRVTLDKYQHAFLEEIHTTSLATLQDPLVSLLLLAGRQQYDQQGLVKNILAAVSCGWGGLDKCLAVLKTIKHEREIHLSSEIQSDIVTRLMVANRAMNALHILLDSPDVPFALVSDLPELLLKSNVAPPLVLETIKEHHAAQSGPSRVRFLAENVIELVLQLAWATSQSSRSSATTAFNHVWRCYRFLSDRNIRMDATISKAMFHAGVVRAMQTQGRLPQQRLKYIMQMVRWYEGDKVADDLYETTIYTRGRKLQTPPFPPEQAFVYDKTARLKLRPRF